uniref:Something about silencing protein 10 n=2 Tax=Cacopsylla melanoneura TaxID=428564 RepID=A0A8D8SWD1_9HEMI
MGKSKKKRSNLSKSNSRLIDIDDADVNMKLSDSDEDPDEKILLDEVLNPKKKATLENQDETSIYGIGDSSDDDNEEEEDDSEEGSELEEEDNEEVSELEEEDDQDLKDELADSDIDGMEEDDLPNIKAWGKNKRIYYNTDYVDDDHGGFQEEEDEVAADVEEQEAMSIQKRLLSEIDATDDVFEFLVQKPKEDSKEDKQTIVISKDLSEMSKKEKLQLLEKESPEFQGLVNDFKELMKDVKLHLLPVVKLLDQGRIPPCTAGDTVRLRFELILNYCTNICFYLLLKLKRQSVHQHPVIHRLVATKQLILKLDHIYQDQLLPQIELILTTDNLESFIEPVIVEPSEEETVKGKKPQETDMKKKNKNALKEDEVMEAEQDGKRAITYQIAKNKGLTPHRKKELKNPRVKHKLKFRKAKIRRKGQIREPRKELERYGGELSGIKASARKSIAIK